MTARDIERFLAKVSILTDDDCWLWTASRVPCPRGYFKGNISWEGRIQAAHRVAYQLQFGPITSRDYVLHHCDNGLCCNPMHLFIGTQADNMADMVAKGRSLHRHGAANPHCKLSSADVEAIREQYRKVPNGVLAERYKVSPTQIWRVGSGRQWRSGP